MSLLEIYFQILLVFAPHVGYVAQYFEIANTNSIEGYAPLVSLILLTSNTLRLYYYIGEHFMLALLFQAIFGCVVHFILLLKVLDVHVSQVVSEHQEAVLFGVNVATSSFIGVPISTEDTGGKTTPVVTEAQSPPNLSTAGHADMILADAAGCASSPVAVAFFRFSRFLFQVEDMLEQDLLRLTPRKFAFSYAAGACVALVVAIFYYFSIGRVWSAAPVVIGYISLGVEAMLVVPQILRNARRRSTEGLSILLILTWVVGDIVKVIYYSYAKQALPFIICGIFQILLDIVVVGQVVFYPFYLRGDSVGNGGEEAATLPQDNL